MQDETKTGKKLGLTPVLVRLAWSFAQKGVGVHYVEHPEYDNVVVAPIYDWSMVDGVGQGALRVTFKRGRTIRRYVEFGCKLIGGGGDEVFKLATPGTLFP